MSDTTDLLKNTLRRNNQSMTAARMTVFKMLNGKEPQTMQALVEACAGAVNRASVYRTVSLFEQLGIVQRLQIGWKYKLELAGDFHAHHHHLTCTRCGITKTIPEDVHLEDHLRDAAQAQDFVMHGHQLEIQGICSSCVKITPYATP